MNLNTEQRRPAIVSADYPDQRRYEETQHRRLIGLPLEYLPAVEIYRHGTDDTAQLRIELLGSVAVSIGLTPQGLRRLASDLLDAAQDIEANPASLLAYQAEQDQIDVIADPVGVLADTMPADAAPALAAKQFDEYHGWVPA